MKNEISKEQTDEEFWDSVDIHKEEEKYAKESYLQPEPYLNSEFWKNNIATFLLEQYKPYMSGNVADFGCNNGLNVAKISLHDSVKKIVGFDIFEESIKVAEEIVLPQVPETKEKIEFVVANLANLNWQEEFFDFGYSFHVLEHIFPEDVDAVMKETTKTIKLGGHMLINMPDKHSCPWETKHVYHPDLAELNELMEKHGYETVESYADERGGQVGNSRNITGLYKKIFDVTATKEAEEA